MRKFLATSLLIVIPAAALALDYTDVSGGYADAPFSRPEAAAISLLTNLEVVEGDPNPEDESHRLFHPERPLNRAEFAKIVFMARGSNTPPPLFDCFPDVTREWFSPFVCYEKQLGAVKGYPDGLFHPERNVNYAEALKILTVSFGYEIPSPLPREHWYLPYARAAQEHKTVLPVSIAYDAALTRGQMARLAAGFVAEANGELDLYRMAERGQTPVRSSSSTSSSSSSFSSASSLSSSPASSASSTSSSFSVIHDFPARSRFLVAGERSQPIASATFFANLEAMFVRRAEVKLKNKIDGIDSMYIVAADGTELGQIALDKVFDTTEKTWRGALTSNYRIPKGEQRVIGVEIRMKVRNQGGTSEEMVQVDSLKLTVEGEWSTETSTTGTDGGPYPKHQTSMGRITSVRNAQEATGFLPLGPGQQLASFTIAGSAVENVNLKIEHLLFQVTASTFVNISNWQLGIVDSSERMNCSYNSTDFAVSCSSLTDSLGTLGGGSRTFRFYGDVSLASGATAKDLQISLNLAGNLETLGAVRWTDGTGHFSWVELEEPLARGTIWK